MKLPPALLGLSRRMHLPLGLLIAFLQRTPVARVAAVLDEIAAASPIGDILKSAAAAAASLGVLNSVAGASSYMMAVSPANEYLGTAGMLLFNPDGGATIITFAVVTPSGANQVASEQLWGPNSWVLSGQFPTGTACGSAGAFSVLRSTGEIDTPEQGAGNFTTPVGWLEIYGTPSTPGIYNLILTAYQDSHATGDSATFPYTFVISPPANTPGIVSITTQPASQTVAAGSKVTLSVAATGATAYQWQQVSPTVEQPNGVFLSDGGTISGSATNTLTLTNVSASQAGNYSVIVSNSVGPVPSSTAALTVTAATAVAPSFTSNPGNQTVVSGTTVVFNSTATGLPAPTYQWNLNGSAISGATSARLVVSGATAASAGTYACVAANGSGSATSTAATLSIDSTAADMANPGRLINLSVNTFDGTGNQAMTIGFATGGLGSTGTQTLLIRASGPALTPYYGSAVLPDPTLTLYDHTAAVIVTNAGWGTLASNETAVIAGDAATGAFSLTNANSLDSAVVETLTGNFAYTVAISGKSGDTGQTIAEVYDGTPSGTYTLTTPRLINLSCKIQVGATSTLTAGFVVGGSTSKSVLVRASGPALAGFVSGTMPDPQLQLFTGSTLIALNAGWGGDPQLTAAMTAVYAFTYTSASSKDSAILVTLPPGSYTAQASSVGGNAGITLVEVYEVP